MSIIEIVFQSGEFTEADSSFWLDLLINISGAVIGGLIGAGTAMLVFNKTVGHDRAKQADNEKKLMNEKLSYFSSMVRSISGQSVQQSEHFDEFLKEFKNDFMQVPRITSLPLFEMKRFIEMPNHEEYYHAYLSKFGFEPEIVKEYRTIYSTIEFIYAMVQQALDTLDKALNFDYERKDSYRKIVEETMGKAAEIVVDARNSGKADDFAVYINSVLLAYHTRENVDHSDLRRVQAEFTDIVKLECVFRFNHLPIATEIAEALKKATHIFSHIEFSNKGVYQDYAEQIERFKAASVKLKGISERLENEKSVK